MFYLYVLSGLLLLVLDPSMIYGQTTQDNRTASEDDSLIVRTENAQKELNNSLSKETHNGTHEDREDFQDQEYLYGGCYEEELKYLGEHLCCKIFDKNMHEVGTENWCNMEMVIRSYNMLTECMEIGSNYSRCYYPNRVVEQLFVKVHQNYFSFCRNEEDLADAPAGVVLLATLMPILLIPFIVYILVWKSSLRD